MKMMSKEQREIIWRRSADEVMKKIQKPIDQHDVYEGFDVLDLLNVPGLTRLFPFQPSIHSSHTSCQIHRILSTGIHLVRLQDGIVSGSLQILSFIPWLSISVVLFSFG